MNEERENLVVLPFAYNDIGNGSRVTERRIKLAIDEVRKRKGRRLFSLTAGYGKHDPGWPNKSRREPLCYQMAEYIKTFYLAESEHLSVEALPLGWGTLSEIVEAIRFGLDYYGLKPAVLVLVSSSDHLNRIKLYLRFILPLNWTAEYCAVDHQLDEPWKERIKFIKDLPKILMIGLKIWLTGRL